MCIMSTGSNFFFITNLFFETSFLSIVAIPFEIFENKSGTLVETTCFDASWFSDLFNLIHSASECE